jgi:hypothetical protein
MRSVFILCVLVLFAFGANAEDPKPYPYPDHIHTVWGCRVYSENDGKVLVPPSISFSLMGQTGQNKAIDCTVVAIGDEKNPIYLNGVKYDIDGRVWPAEFQEEVIRWYVFCGPFKVNKRDGGGWNFDSLVGKELDTLNERNMKHWVRRTQADDIIYTQFTPRLKTMAECRALWKKELANEIKWDFDKRKYVDVPVGKRKPLMPEKFDPRALPVITPDI